MPFQEQTNVYAPGYLSHGNEAASQVLTLHRRLDSLRAEADKKVSAAVAQANADAEKIVAEASDQEGLSRIHASAQQFADAANTQSLETWEQADQLGHLDTLLAAHEKQSAAAADAAIQKIRQQLANHTAPLAIVRAAIAALLRQFVLDHPQDFPKGKQTRQCTHCSFSYTVGKPRTVLAEGAMAQTAMERLQELDRADRLKAFRKSLATWLAKRLPASAGYAVLRGLKTILTLWESAQSEYGQLIRIKNEINWQVLTGKIDAEIDDLADKGVPIVRVRDKTVSWDSMATEVREPGAPIESRPKPSGTRAKRANVTLPGQQLLFVK